MYLSRFTGFSPSVADDMRQHYDKGSAGSEKQASRSYRIKTTSLDPSTETPPH